MKSRTIYIDYLRCFAAFAVVAIHICAMNWYTDSVDLNWHIINFYDSIVRWSVPVFVMISGALFIPREIEIKVLLKKYILKMVICFFVWSLFYAVLNNIIRNALANEPFDISSALVTLINGNHHMWFIPMIIGLYLCLPIFRKIALSPELMKYFLVISFIFAFCVPEALNLLIDLSNGIIKSGFKEIKTSFENMHLDVLTGYGFYFVLGYFLDTLIITKKAKKIILFSGSCAFLLTVALSAIVSEIKGKPCSTYYENFTVNVALEALLIFVIFKQLNYNNCRNNQFVQKLSKLCFGVYLIHPALIEFLNFVHIDTLTINPVISIALLSLFVTAVAFLISFLISKIPFLNKWII